MNRVREDEPTLKTKEVIVQNTDQERIVKIIDEANESKIFFTKINRKFSSERLVKIRNADVLRQFRKGFAIRAPLWPYHLGIRRWKQFEID